MKGKIDYKDILLNNHWLFEKDRTCIISPDIDGILCGMFMSNYFNWKIGGYYNGKIMVIHQGVDIKECVFLDMEIFRKDIKSIGQHMLLFNNRNFPENFYQNFENCINPNLLRSFDAMSNFKSKYPLATIHLLMCILRNKIEFTIHPSSITLLLYVDGTFKNLLNYPENCINWLHYLDAKNPQSPIAGLLNLFATQKISKTMHDLEDLFHKFKEIAGNKRGGDKINLDKIENQQFSKEMINQTHKLLEFISSLTEWEFKHENWFMNNLKVIKLIKETENKLNTNLYTNIISQNPISFAITATKRLEYTLNHNLF